MSRLTDEELRSFAEDIARNQDARRAMSTELLALRALSSESVEWLDASLGQVRGEGPPNWDGIRAHLTILSAALLVQS